MSERGLRVVPPHDLPPSATPPVARRGMAAINRLGDGRLSAFWRGLGRRSVLISFGLLAMLPAALVAGYMYGYASDQYVTEMKLGVRTVESRGGDGAAIFQGAASASQIGLDSYVVVQYIQSREFVDRLQAKVDLQRIYARSSIDELSRLPRGASAEQLVEYWRGMVDPFFDMTNGTITVRVRAFTAPEALSLANQIETICQDLIASLTAKMRSQTVAMAEEETRQAEERLKAVLHQREALRQREGTTDPGRVAESTYRALGSLREDLGRARAELENMRRNGSDERLTRVVNLKNRVASLEREVASIERETSAVTTQQSTLAQSTTQFEELAAEQKIAERVLGVSLETLEKTRLTAGRQGTYLLSFVHATLPEEPLYPRRARTVVVVLIAGFILWAVFWLAAAAIKEHL